jgi:hypothetical protein
LATIKGLFNLALRQAMGMAQSLFKLAGLDRQVPDFSTISRRQKYLSVTVGVQPTTTGLHLLIDSRASRCWGKASGRPKSMGPTIVASGARSTFVIKNARITPGVFFCCCRSTWLFARRAKIHS